MGKDGSVFAPSPTQRDDQRSRRIDAIYLTDGSGEPAVHRLSAQINWQRDECVSIEAVARTAPKRGPRWLSRAVAEQPLAREELGALEGLFRGLPLWRFTQSRDPFGTRPYRQSIHRIEHLPLRSLG